MKIHHFSRASGCRQDDSVAKETRQLSSHHSASWISSDYGADRLSDRRVRVHRFANLGTSRQEIGLGHSDKDAAAVNNVPDAVVSVSKTIVRHQASSKRNRPLARMVHNLMNAGLLNPGRRRWAVSPEHIAARHPLSAPARHRSLQTTGLAAWAQAGLGRGASSWFGRNPLHRIWPHHLHVLDQLRDHRPAVAPKNHLSSGGIRVSCRPRPERLAPTERHADARPCGSHRFHRQSSG